MKKTTRFISLVLSVLLIFSAVYVQCFATTPEETTTTTTTTTETTTESTTSAADAKKAAEEAAKKKKEAAQKKVKATTLKLKAVTNTAKGVKITWTAIANTEGYRIYRKAGSATKWTLIKTVTGQKTASYTDTTVKSGTKYRYTVRGYNGKAFSKYNTSGLTTYFLTAVTPKVTVNNSGITIKWSKVKGATNYTIYRKVKGAKSSTALATVKSGTTSYVDKKAKVNTTYTYTVRAKKVVTSGSKKVTYAGAYTSVNKRMLAKPTVTCSNASKGVVIKWNKVSGATKYYIYRRLVTSNTWTKIKSVDYKTTSYTDTKAVYNNNYYYCVRAVCSEGNSKWDSIYVSRYKAPKLTVTVFPNGYRLDWTASGSPAKYIIYRSTDGGKTFKAYTTVNKKYKYYQETFTKKGTYKYQFKVKAIYICNNKNSAATSSAGNANVTVATKPTKNVYKLYYAKNGEKIKYVYYAVQLDSYVQSINEKNDVITIRYYDDSTETIRKCTTCGLYNCTCPEDTSPYVCPYCGMQNPLCQRDVNGDPWTCEDCGEYVPANTCHHCQNLDNYV